MEWRPIDLPVLFEEQGWLRGEALVDRIAWVSDPEAAAILAQHFRTASLDEQDRESLLRSIAYLDPEEARQCIACLAAEPIGGGELSRASFLDSLQEIVADGSLIREFAANASLREEGVVSAMALPPDHPERYDRLRALLIAAALADPVSAAHHLFHVQPFHCPEVSRAVVTRLFRRDPDAAVGLLAQTKGGDSLLPVLVQRMVTQPSSENLRLLQALLALTGEVSWVSLCVTVVRVIRAAPRWGFAERRVLLDAAAHAAMDYRANTDWAASRHEHFKSELAIQIARLKLGSADDA